ncbi:MAG: DUF3039 domain-containing protein [Actinomycetota bacterium]|nr:DUF3039 domain-containing protein [Actinomycetota bacterium]
MRMDTAPLASPGPSPEPSPGLSGDTLLEERATLSNDDGDHERFAHYVEKAKIMESAVTGVPVKALCGKVWIPNRDPSRFPVCPECQEIHKNLSRT